MNRNAKTINEKINWVQFVPLDNDDKWKYDKNFIPILEQASMMALNGIIEGYYTIVLKYTFTCLKKI